MDEIPFRRRIHSPACGRRFGKKALNIVSRCLATFVETFSIYVLGKDAGASPRPVATY